MRTILLALVVLLLVSTVASANGLGVFGSWWKPKDLDDAYGGGAKIQMEVVPSVFVEARGSYFYQVKEEDGSDEVKTSIIPVQGLGIVKFPVSDQFVPYVGGGVGYYFFQIDEDIPDVKIEVDNKFGICAVGGVELALGEDAALFGEAMYTWLPDVTAKATSGGLTLESDGDLSGLGVNAGLLFRW